MARGRPKKTLDDLPANWKEEMLAQAEVGASEVELRAYALGGISEDLWYRFKEEEPEFSKTVKKCKDLCAAWWEREGRTNLKEKDFSYTGWYMNMKNRFGWKDKQEIEHSGEIGKVSDEELDAQILKLIGKAGIDSPAGGEEQAD